MRQHRAAEQALGKALTLWEAPDNAGEPLVCVATTFTFDATFFETECLGRFLQMDSHPSESASVAYLIEREEKLAAAQVCVLVDRRHARDKESLRWDVLGVLVPRAIQHAKVSVLAWANHVRVIIASGNLTEPGYRKNVEVFGAFDISRQTGGDLDALARTLDFLVEVVSFVVGIDGPDTPRGRATAALQSVRAHVQGWPVNATGSSRRGAVAVFGGPGRSVLHELESLWPNPARPPREAYVLSPFFDCGTDDTVPVSALVSLLAKRGKREVCFDVRAEPTADGRTRLFAPQGMVAYARKHADTSVRRVLPEQQGEVRDLHAKMIYLCSDDWVLLLMGSSNFTAAGTGTARNRANLEANIVYRFRASGAEADVLEHVWPAFGEELDIDSLDLVWNPGEAGEEGAGTDIPLPAAFVDAVFVPGPEPSLSITLAEPLPTLWSIRVPGGSEILSSNGAGPGTHIVRWVEQAAPFVLEVTWHREEGIAVATWPVNVSNPGALPPPEALRDLTLEELLDILASTRPLPQAVEDALKRRTRHTSRAGDELDPLRRFDSQAFLLRRTKRVAAALERLRERLERPVLTQDAFEWRLSGPVGPLALADAFVRESRLPGEAMFCLAELALALRRVRADRAASGGIHRAVLQDRLNAAIDQVERRARELPPTPEIETYVTAAFAEARS